MVHRQQGRWHQTRVLTRKWCATTSNMLLDPTQAVGPGAHEPVGLGLTGPHITHRKGSEASKAIVSTGQGGRSDHSYQPVIPSQGPTLVARTPGRVARGPWVLSGRVARGVLVPLPLQLVARVRG